MADLYDLQLNAKFKYKMWYVLFVLLSTLLYYVCATVDITFKKYEMCEDHKDTPMQYWANFTKINSSISLLNGKAILPYPIGDDVKLDAVIEIFREETWKVLYTFKNKPMCQLLEKYGGDLWFNAQEYIEIPKGTCPIPEGTYDLKDFVVDFNLLPVKTAPKALMRSTANLMREGELLLCYYIEFESM